MDTIALLTTLDENYLPQLQVLLFSIYLNNPGENCSLYLIHSGIREESLGRIQSQCRHYAYSFHPIAVNESLFRDAPVTRQYPNKEMYYRLLASHLLPQSIKRVLYLDPDILVINPLRPLWEVELGGKLFAAAAHTGMTELANNVNRLRLGTQQDYYNSGVLLMDLEAGHREIDPQQIFAFVEKHGRELLLPDQDILNAVYSDKILPLEDVLWNYDARNYSSYLLRSSGLCDLNWVMEHTSILHFCGKEKPWKPNYHHRFGILYLHYMQLTKRDLDGRLSG